MASDLGPARLTRRAAVYGQRNLLYNWPVSPCGPETTAIEGILVEVGALDKVVMTDLNPEMKLAAGVGMGDLGRPLSRLFSSDGKPGALEGLSEEEVIARRARGLGNDVTYKTSRTLGQILRENLFTFFNMVLFILGVLLVIFGSPVEALITSGVLLINVIVASVQEVQAKKKLDHIALLTRPTAVVIREGKEHEIDPNDLVWGDLVVVEPGAQVVVDGEVISQGRFDVDESLLTGESRLVAKHQGDKVLSGSFCVTGRGVFEATRVGVNSYANKLTMEARTFTRNLTPLQREVYLVIRVLLGLAVFFGVLLIVNNALNGVQTLESVRQTSVLFGLAPSSLFLMIVVAYAVGAVRIANKGALVQQANSVESLCNVDILCLDKTGTLTTNRLSLDEIYPCLGQSGAAEEDLAARLEELQQQLGDFCQSATVQNRTNEAILRAYPGQARSLLEEVSFSSQLGWSALVLAEAGRPVTYVLGGPELLEPNLAAGSDLGDRIDAWRAQGRRVLLFASLPGEAPLYEDDEPRLPEGLRPLCLLKFGEELRADARETLKSFAAAGIKLKFISGDNPETVAALVRQTGLVAEEEPLSTISGLELVDMNEAALASTVAQTTVFGRIVPRQKEQIVRALRDQGHYVAMTGDGVNDVLALKWANLGIAMHSGSQATRNVADMVLIDDSFSVLPEAFREGQRIMSGMEDILRLYLSRIFYLGILIAAIGFVGAGFPFTPKQNAVVSVFTMSIPGFCLALWARPKPVARVSLMRRLAHFIFPAALTVSVVGIAVYLYTLVLEGDLFYAQTMLTYTVIVCGILSLIFVEPPTRWWVGGDTLSGDWRPTYLAGGLLLMFAAFLVVPFLREFYGLVLLRSWSHYLVIGVAAVVWVFLVRFVWRANLMERYLNVDLGVKEQAGEGGG